MNKVQGCFLGTNIAGTIARPSGWLPWNPPTVVGVYLARRAANNIVGSDGDGTEEEAERNLISGEARDMFMAGHGVLMDGSQGMVSNTLVAGNLIGTTPDPEVALGNNYGVTLFSGVSNNTIAGNVIAGNNEDGIWAGAWMGSVAVANLDNRIYGNFIGINPNSDNAVPNGQDGIHLNPGNQGTLVGITDWTLANVISGNGRHGVFLQGSAGNDSFDNIFAYNIVGMDTSGAFAVPNGGDGFHLEFTLARNFIGNGTDGNLISGNGGDGVYLMDADSVVIQNNVFGLNMAQDTTQANDGDGIALYCSDVACCDSTIAWQNPRQRRQRNRPVRLPHRQRHRPQHHRQQRPVRVLLAARRRLQRPLGQYRRVQRPESGTLRRSWHRTLRQLSPGGWKHHHRQPGLGDRQLPLLRQRPLPRRGGQRRGGHSNHRRQRYRRQPERRDRQLRLRAGQRLHLAHRQHHR
jgi:hypothetical protein